MRNTNEKIDVDNMILNQRVTTENTLKKDEAIDKCLLLGDKFLSLYKELFSTSQKELNPKLIQQMQYYYDFARKIKIEGYKKVISSIALYDWFFLKGSSIDSLFEDEIDEEIYELFIEKLLDCDNVDEAFCFIRSDDFLKIFSKLNKQTKKGKLISKICDVACTIASDTIQCMINKNINEEQIKEIISSFIYLKKQNLKELNLNDIDRGSSYKIKKRISTMNNSLYAQIEKTYDDLSSLLYEIYRKYQEAFIPLLNENIENNQIELEQNLREIINSFINDKQIKFTKSWQPTLFRLSHNRYLL